MKIIELVNKVHIPITNEEADILGKFEENKEVEKKKMSDRERVLANSLVNKNILLRNKKDGKIVYRKKQGI